MAVKIDSRNGRLAYRLCLDGEQWREATELRDTPRNREKLERRCRPHGRGTVRLSPVVSRWEPRRTLSTSSSC